MAVDHETLLGWLTRLQLTAIRDQLDNLLDEAAEKKLTLREALAMLVEREVSRKDERRIEMALKIARFPMVRELADFDFKAQPSVDRRQDGWPTRRPGRASRRRCQGAEGPPSSGYLPFEAVLPARLTSAGELRTSATRRKRRAGALKIPAPKPVAAETRSGASS